MTNLTNIFITKAITQEDMQKVFDVRWLGYRKYFDGRDEVIDPYDFAPNATLLLATDEMNHAIGTIRILNRGHGEIELDPYLNVDTILSETEKPCAEATRISVPPHPKARSIKSALWEGFYKYCSENQIRTMIAWVRRGALRKYSYLSFEKVGAAFHHPLLGNKEHHVIKLNMSHAPVLYQSRSELYDLGTQYHSNIRIGGGPGEASTGRLEFVRENV